LPCKLDARRTVWKKVESDSTVDLVNTSAEKSVAAVERYQVVPESLWAM
jgi:hypothetical protein